MTTRPYSVALKPLAFGGNPLFRQAREHADPIQSLRAQGTRFLLLDGRDIAVEKAEAGAPRRRGRGSLKLCWYSYDEILALGLSPYAGGDPAPAGSDGAELPSGTVVPAYVLGSSEAGDGSRASAHPPPPNAVPDPSAAQHDPKVWDAPSTPPPARARVVLGHARVALSLASLPAGSPAREAAAKAADFAPMRAAAPALSREEAAVAGQGVALASWHSAHAFCGRCGAPTETAGAGARRQCTRDASHVHYPRTDPVAITVVESRDGSRCLVGRGVRMPEGVMTCLAGFVDQAESVEEAVAREVLEESGVVVDRVQVLGTQPWPIGRGGSCELMLGCVARAATEEILLDPDELEDARWVSRADVLAALGLARGAVGARAFGSLGGASSDAESGGSSGGEGEASGAARRDVAPAPPPSHEPVKFLAPPPMAIANHLLRAWATRKSRWFDDAGEVGPTTSKY